MRQLFPKILFILFLFLNASGLSGQYKDFRSWWGAELSKDIGSDLKLGLKVNQRFKYNSLTYDRSLATFTAGYEVIKNLSVEAGYRYVLLNDPQSGFYSKYRVHGSLKYEIKWYDFSLDIRDQVQYGFDDLNTLDVFYDNKLTNRTRLNLKYDIFGVPLQIHASIEYFLNLNSGGGIYPLAYRIKTGIEYSISMKSELDLSYMLEDEMNVRYPLQSHIIAVSFSYDL